MKALAVLALVAGPSLLRSQETRLIPDTDSTYVVIVGNDTLYAITNSMRKAHVTALDDLDSARKVIEVQKATISSYAQLDSAVRVAMAKDSAVITQQGAQISDFRALEDALRRKLLLANPTFSATLGGGFSDGRPAGIAGVGYKRVRLWRTFQRSDPGWFGGIFLPFTLF